MPDEAYAKNYSTGATSTRSSNRLKRSAEAGLLAAALVIPAICDQIDRAASAKARNEKCDEFFRTLSTGDAPAYEWQNYYSRCKGIK